MGVHINAIGLTSSVVVWVLTWQIVWGLVSVIGNPSVAAWSLGPFGIRTVPVRQQSPARLSLAVLLAGISLASAGYLCLYSLHPAPVSGLGDSLADRLAVVASLVAGFVLIRLLLLARDRRNTIYGDVRLITAVRASAVTGSFVFFTRAGRAYLREHFGASPKQFVRLVAERDRALPAQEAR